MKSGNRPTIRALAFAGALLAAALAPAASAQAWTFKTIHNFCAKANCADGQIPASVMFDPSGRLVGLTYEGGPGGGGTVFSLKLNADGTKWKYQVLEDNAGGLPAPGLVEDVRHNLYWASGSGASQIFELERDGQLLAIHTFCLSCGEGSDPQSLTYAGAVSGMPYDGHSPLYGVSRGLNNGGQIFRLAKKPRRAWDLKVIYVFCPQGPCTDGSGPASLLADTSGNLFGITSAGGAMNGGIVFELSPTPGQHWTETVLHDFCVDADCTDGKLPTGTLTMDANGILYGVTQNGGTAGLGTLFKVVPDGSNSQETVLHSFCSDANCADGWNPVAGPVVDAEGTLFGTTSFGGTHQNAGVAYEMSGSTYQKLYDFCALADCADGSSPAVVTLDGAGDVFGVTWAGGKHSNSGTVFELSP